MLGNTRPVNRARADPDGHRHAIRARVLLFGRYRRPCQPIDGKPGPSAGDEALKDEAGGAFFICILDTNLVCGHLMSEIITVTGQRDLPFSTQHAEWAGCCKRLGGLCVGSRGR